MLYRDYGKTGKKVSAIGFGGMRFADIDKKDDCIELMVKAAEGGINYFDTAPGYFATKSESLFGEALKEMRQRQLPYYLSTKTFKSEEGDIRRELEAQLRRLDVDSIDFYHMWCITTLANWDQRKKDGIIKTFLKLKEEGLINHICVSSHLIGDEIKELLQEEVFEGVLMGYSAYNFATRQAAFDAITQKDLGCVVMNPLGGGLIPQNPDFFNFIKTQENESIVEAAIRFLLAHEPISTTLVGFSELSHLTEALRAVDGYKPISTEKMGQIKEHAASSMEGVCTGCQYCDKCPEGIQIPKFMDTYNLKSLAKTEDDVINRMKLHWGIESAEAAKCIGCGICEEACTQHLPIIERLDEIAGMNFSL